MLNCNGNSILGSFKGSAFFMNNVSNVTLANCDMDQFATGVNASGSGQINLNSLTIRNVSQGVYFSKTSLANVANVVVSSYTRAGFDFSWVNSSTVTQNRATEGTSSADGFVFSNDTNDHVSFNKAELNSRYGFAFIDSVNNNVFNNSAFSNTKLDYYCSPSSSGLYANPINVNLGLTKNICRWLVEVPRITFNPACEAVSSSSEIVLSEDMLYTYGTTCFNIFNTKSSSSNDTVINCNGRTIYAARGGTFVNIVNSTGVRIENCYIANFTDAIVSSGPKTSVVNNTVLNSGTAVILNRSSFANVEKNRVENSTSGVVAIGSDYSKIIDNRFYNVGNSIYISGGSLMTIENNTATNGVFGAYMSNTISDMVKHNTLLNMSSSGIICLGSGSSVSDGNRDLGRNECSGNTGCAWMTSPSCLPR